MVERYFLGVDGGGSKCKASLADAEGRVLGSALSGPANPFHGIQQTLHSIESAARGALRNAGLPGSALGSLVAGVGLAGVNLPSLYQIISEWSHPFAQLHLTTDLRIACLGAHQSDEGAIIVTGTGSCGFVRAGGKEHLFGGHGFPCGDQGSGAWMGLEAIKSVLLASDELGPKTQLTDVIADLLEARGVVIVERLSGKPSSDYARLAPLVFAAAEANDPVALEIVQRGADYISAMARKLLAHKPSRLSMIGGLAERLEPWLDVGVVGKLARPLGTPDAGALRFARQESALSEGRVAHMAFDR